MLESPVDFCLKVDRGATFELSGSTTHRFKLEPSAETSTFYEALIPRAGMHDLQVFLLDVFQEEGVETYPLPEQWLIEVYDSSSAPPPQ